MNAQTHTSEEGKLALIFRKKEPTDLHLASYEIHEGTGANREIEPHPTLPTDMSSWNLRDFLIKLNQLEEVMDEPYDNPVDGHHVNTAQAGRALESVKEELKKYISKDPKRLMPLALLAQIMENRLPYELLSREDELYLRSIGVEIISIKYNTPNS